MNTDLLQREDFGSGKTLDSMELAALKQLNSHKAQEAAVACLAKFILSCDEAIFNEDLVISSARMTANSGSPTRRQQTGHRQSARNPKTDRPKPRGTLANTENAE